MSFADLIIKERSLGCCKATVPVEAAYPNDYPQACKKKKQETTMRDRIDVNLDINAQTSAQPTADQAKVQYLADQLRDASFAKRDTAYTAFNMDGPGDAASPKEFVERIKNGQFKFSKDRLNDDGSWRTESGTGFFSSWDLPRFLTWDVPGKMPDQAGFDAAEEKLDAARKTAERLIQVMTPADGLKALNDFEAVTIN